MFKAKHDPLTEGADWILPHLGFTAWKDLGAKLNLHPELSISPISRRNSDYSVHHSERDRIELGGGDTCNSQHSSSASSVHAHRSPKPHPRARSICEGRKRVKEESQEEQWIRDEERSYFFLLKPIDKIPKCIHTHAQVSIHIYKYAQTCTQHTHTASSSKEEP